MNKKLLLVISMCLCILGMTACAKTDPTTVDYNGYTYSDIQDNVQGTVSTLASLSDEDKATYLAQNDEMLTNLITRWNTASEGIGSFVGFGDFTIAKAGKVLTAEQIVQFEDRPVTVTFVYNYNTMALDDVTIDQVLTLGEKMSTAGLNTVMGIGTVFVILILISLIICCFNIIPYLANRKKETAPVAAPAKDQFVEQVAQREQLQDDLELTAVIAAAIAASTGTSTDDFVVRSIKRR